MVWEKIYQKITLNPDKNAIYFQDHQISYDQVGDIVTKLAQGLKTAGIEKGDRIALVMPNLPHFIFSYYACLRIGAIIIPINYMLAADDFDYVLHNSKPKAVIYWEGFRGLLTKFFQTYNEGLIKIVLGEKNQIDNFSLTSLIVEKSSDEIAAEISPEDTALIQYTSGTADRPAGVEITHESLSVSIDSFVEFYRLTKLDTFGIVLPLFLIINHNTVLNTAFLLGSSIVLHPKIDFDAITKSIDQHRITVLVASPNFFNRLVEFKEKEKDFDGSSLRICLSVQSSLSEELAERFEKQFDIPLLNGYAVVEGCGLISATYPSIDNLSGTVGVVQSSFEVQIHDSQGGLVTNDAIGEIAVRGKALFKCYWNNEELTAERIKNGWFYPGDIGKKSVDGIITLVEKKSNIILKSGFQILASEIEQVLMSHPKIKEAAVVPVPHPEHKEDVKAYVVPLDKENLSSDDVVEFCRQKFPVYKCPQYVEFLEELPRTKMGRIFKRKLKQEFINKR